jgi:hypothetical protein
MAIDIDEMRDRTIAMNGLPKADQAYVFYYDETNNVRRLYTSDKGLNVGAPGCFVLAGVVHTGAPRQIDISSLKQAVRLQANAEEIKLKHLGKGDFLTLLAAPKVGAMLDWFLDAGLLIHFQVLDPLYWSIVDIVDSVVDDDVQLIMASPMLKDALYAALRRDVPGMAALFNEFRYPGLKRGDAPAFVEALRDLVTPQLHYLHPQHRHAVQTILRLAGEQDELTFIEGDEENVLINDFAAFYRDRLVLFANATHVFDHEDYIEERLAKHPLHRGGKPVQHYRFANSKDEPAIQLADLIAGLIGKYYSYLAATSVNQVVADRANLSEVQLRHLGTLKRLVDLSDSENPAFFHHILSLAEHWKNRVFLHPDEPG